MFRNERTLTLIGSFHGTGALGGTHRVERAVGKRDPAHLDLFDKARDIPRRAEIADDLTFLSGAGLVKGEDVLQRAEAAEAKADELEQAFAEAGQCVAAGEIG